MINLNLFLFLSFSPRKKKKLMINKLKLSKKHRKYHIMVSLRFCDVIKLNLFIARGIRSNPVLISEKIHLFEIEMGIIP